MNRKSFLAGSALVAALAAFTLPNGLKAQPGGKYKIGDKPANFTLKDDRGQTHTLSEYRGKVIILNFYASW